MPMPSGMRCLGCADDVDGLCTRHFEVPQWVEAFDGQWCPQCDAEITSRRNRGRDIPPESIVDVTLTRTMARLCDLLEENIAVMKAGHGFVPQQQSQHREQGSSEVRCHWCHQWGHAMPTCSNPPSQDGYIGRKATWQQRQAQTPGWQAWKDHKAWQIPPPPPKDPVEFRPRSRSRDRGGRR